MDEKAVSKRYLQSRYIYLTGEHQICSPTPECFVFRQTPISAPYHRIASTSAVRSGMSYDGPVRAISDLHLISPRWMVDPSVTRWPPFTDPGVSPARSRFVRLCPARSARTAAAQRSADQCPLSELGQYATPATCGRPGALVTSSVTSVTASCRSAISGKYQFAVGST